MKLHKVDVFSLNSRILVLQLKLFTMVSLTIRLNIDCYKVNKNFSYFIKFYR